VTGYMSHVRSLLAGITDLCPEHLRQSIRHVQRNCDIECNVHDAGPDWEDCKQPDRAAGERMAQALAEIPDLLARLDAVEKIAASMDRIAEFNLSILPSDDMGISLKQHAQDLRAALIGEGES
jgi:hypothetical protein